jgi:exopolyphosphatase/guanosine-5'-triphosphate,3'-diphosphate pyrophosphatase
VTLNVMSGKDEARVTFLAARRWFGWSAGKILLLDIGGGSLEIAAGQDEYPAGGGIGSIWAPVGPTRTSCPTICPRTEDIHSLRKHARAQIGKIAGKINRVGHSDQVVGSSKTFRSLARIAGAAPSGDGIYAPRKLFRRDLEGSSTPWHRALPIGAGDPARSLRGPRRAGARRRHRRRGGLHDLRHQVMSISPWALREGIIMRKLDLLDSSEQSSAMRVEPVAALD